MDAADRLELRISLLSSSLLFSTAMDSTLIALQCSALHSSTASVLVVLCDSVLRHWTALNVFVLGSM